MPDPIPPDVLIAARQDTLHRESGRLLAARPLPDPEGTVSVKPEQLCRYGPALALIAAATAACSVYLALDRLPSGVTVWWGAMEPEPEAVCRAAEAEPVGAAQAHVGFADLAGVCGRTHVAGCYDAATDWIWIEPGPVERSALGHELIHRRLYRTTGDADNGHTGAEWER